MPYLDLTVNIFVSNILTKKYKTEVYRLLLQYRAACPKFSTAIFLHYVPILQTRAIFPRMTCIGRVQEALDTAPQTANEASR